MTTITDEYADTAKSAERAHHPAQAFAACALVMIATLANLLTYHGYPYFRAEVGIVVGGMIALAAGFALLHKVWGNFGKAVLDGILIIVAIDINTGWTLPAILIGGGAAFLRLHGKSLLTPLSIISAAVLVSSLLGLSQTRPSIAASVGDTKPPTRSDSVLHLILDEHGGSGGAEPALRKELINFYTGRGFRLFDRGYSHHFHTVNAIPDALNFGDPGASKAVHKDLDIGRTRLLSQYEQRGYALNIYQSEFADFCRYQHVSRCTRYWGPSLAFAADRDMSSTQKARLIAFKIASLSKFLRKLPASANYVVMVLGLEDSLDLDPDVADSARSSTLAGLGILDRMAQDLSTAQPGNAYFAHVLAPHYPYVVDGNCRDLPVSQWEFRRSNRPVSVRKAAYAAQANCMMKKVDAILTSFLASPAGKNATIIIHGDHGDRVTSVELDEENIGDIGPSDFMAGYSTLLAVRASGVEPGLDPRPVAVPDALRTIASNDFLALTGLPSGDEQVFLDGPERTIGKPASIKGSWPTGHQ